MRIPAIALLIFSVTIGRSHAQNASPNFKSGKSSNELNIDELVNRHESQLKRVRTADVSWSVKYQAASGETTTEKFRTTLTPSFQATTRWLPNGRPMHSWWDGQQYAQIMGYTPHEPLSRDPMTRPRQGMLYHADQPIQRLFDWRTLRSYRFFANDSDLSLRDLCEQSTIAPVISREGDLIRLELGHPGIEADESKGVHGIPRGTRIQVDLDPLHGHLVRRHETLLKTEEKESDFRQALEVIEFQSISDGVFFPRRVKYSAASVSGDWKTEQAIEFEVSDFNKPIDIERLQFLPNMVVTEFQQYRDKQPLGYYVVSQDIELGPRYSDQAIASTTLMHRMGLIDDESLKTKLAILSTAPVVGSAAPKVHGLDLESGRPEQISLEGRVTAIEFWSTTCGPCQGAMTKFDELAKQIQKQSPDQVQFVSISLDEDVKHVRKHMNERKWKNTRALMDSLIKDDSEPHVGYPFELANQYVVTAIPTCLIVNQQGQIVYRGNLFDDEPSIEINRLLGDEKR